MSGTAFITGGSRGIGRAVARRLAAEGYAVGIDYLQAREAAEALAAEIRSAGGKALAVQGDVSDRGAVTAAIRRVEAAFGPVRSLSRKDQPTDEYAFVTPRLTEGEIEERLALLQSQLITLPAVSPKGIRPWTRWPLPCSPAWPCPTLSPAATTTVKNSSP